MKNQGPAKKMANQTEEKLKGTPFSSAKELREEDEAILLSEWRRLTAAKHAISLLERDEFSSVKEELEAGLSCFVKGLIQEQMFKIYSLGRGLILDLNKDFYKDMGEHEREAYNDALLAAIMGYGAIYLQAKSIANMPSGSLEIPKGKKRS